MTTKPNDILPGLALGAVTFFTILALPAHSAPAFWWMMAGLCGLTMLLAVWAARSSNLHGLFSLAIASVIVFSMVTDHAEAIAGVDPASHPYVFGAFLAVMIGFPLGVLAFFVPFMSPLSAFLAGLGGAIYLPLSMWLTVKLGLTGLLIDVFDPRLQLGHHLGLDGVTFGLLGNLLGMSLASGVTLLVLSLPALPVVMIVRTWFART